MADVSKNLKLELLEKRVAELERRLAHSEDERKAISVVADVQLMAIRQLKASLMWLQRENPLPVGEGYEDPFGLVKAANDAAERFDR